MSGILPASRVEISRGPDGKPRAARGNPVRALAEAQAGRAEAGKAAMITADHVRASERLQRDFDEIATGIGLAPADLLNRSASRGGAGGALSDVMLAAMAHQRAAYARVDGALTYLGALSDVVGAVVLQGVPVTPWAIARGWDRQQAVGYLAAALTRLVEYWGAVDERGGRK